MESSAKIFRNALTKVYPQKPQKYFKNQKRLTDKRASLLKMSGFPSEKAQLVRTGGGRSRSIIYHGIPRIFLLPSSPLPTSHKVFFLAEGLGLLPY